MFLSLTLRQYGHHYVIKHAKSDLVSSLTETKFICMLFCSKLDFFLLFFCLFNHFCFLACAASLDLLFFDIIHAIFDFLPALHVLLCSLLSPFSARCNQEGIRGKWMSI